MTTRPELLLAVACCALVVGTTPVLTQMAVVRGTVTAPPTPVRNAAVTFTESSDPSHAWTALTDSLGHFQILLTLTSAGPGTDLPLQFALAQNYPNPFSATTTIPYDISTGGDSRMTIMDILGRVVRQTTVASQTAGAHRLLWDGTNASGQTVAPGVYFYSLESGGQMQVRKMVLERGRSLVPAPSLPFTAAGSGTAAAGCRAASVYTVRIENAGSTFPSIQTMQIDIGEPQQ